MDEIEDYIDSRYFNLGLSICYMYINLEYYICA